MLKDRGHKGSWKGGGSNNQRTKKKSYGNIHSINDRGIHEIQGRDFLRRLSTYLSIWHICTAEVLCTAYLSLRGCVKGYQKDPGGSIYTTSEIEIYTDE